MLGIIVEVKFVWKASGKVNHKSRESSVCEALGIKALKSLNLHASPMDTDNRMVKGWGKRGAGARRGQRGTKGVYL